MQNTLKMQCRKGTRKGAGGALPHGRLRRHTERGELARARGAEPTGESRTLHHATPSAREVPQTREYLKFRFEISKNGDKTDTVLDTGDEYGHAWYFRHGHACYV